MHPTLKRLRSFACPLTLVGVVVLSSRVGLAQGFNPNGATQLECDGQPACLTPQLGRAIHAEHPELKKMLDGGSYDRRPFGTWWSNSTKPRRLLTCDSIAVPVE